MTGRETFRELRAARGYPVVVLVSSVDRRLLPALRFVSRLPFAEARALHIAVDPDDARAVARDWMALGLTWLPLDIREGTPGEGIAAAVAAAVAGTGTGGVGAGAHDDDDAAGSVTVVVPELDIPRWWHALLHRRTARRIAAELQGTPRITTVIVPFSVVA